MPKITVTDAPEMTLWFHTESKIVHHQMHRYPGVKLLESTLERGLELLVEHQAQKWLSDDRKGGAIPKSHHEWAEKVWGPKAAAAGWRYWALVPPEQVLGQLNMQRLQEIYGALGVTAQVFPEPEEALAWLRKQG